MFYEIVLIRLNFHSYFKKTTPRAFFGQLQPPISRIKNTRDDISYCIYIYTKSVITKDKTLKIYKKSKILKNSNPSCVEKETAFYVFSLIRSRDSVYRYTLKSGPLKKGTTRELRRKRGRCWSGEESLKASIKGGSCGSYYGYYDRNDSVDV